LVVVVCSKIFCREEHLLLGMEFLDLLLRQLGVIDSQRFDCRALEVQEEAREHLCQAEVDLDQRLIGLSPQKVNEHSVVHLGIRV
jgi:hypothetical protein